MKAIIRPFMVFVTFTLLAFVHPIFLIGSAIMILDINARYKDYERYKYRRWSPVMAHLLERSWCSRGVAQAIWEEAPTFYHERGYRFYHILPRGFPRCFIMPSFWKSVVGWRG